MSFFKSFNNKKNNRVIATVLAVFCAVLTVGGLLGFTATTVSADGHDSDVYALPKVKLTDAEKAYITGLDTLTVAYMANMDPACYPENGSMGGYDREFMDCISEMTGLEFNYIEIPRGTRVTSHTVSRLGASMIIDVDANGIKDSLKDVILTDSYYKNSKVFVTDRDSLDFTDNLYVAIPYSIQTTQENMRTYLPKLKLEKGDSIDECFALTARDAYKGVFLHKNVANRLLSNPSYSKYKVVESPEYYEWDSRIALLPNTVGADPELLTILNKAIAAMPEGKVISIVDTYTTGLHNRFNMADAFEQYKFVFIGGIVIILVLVFLIFLLFRSRRKEKHERIRRKQEGYLQDRRYKLIVDESEDVIFEVNLIANTCMNTEKMKRKFNWGFPKVMNNYEKEHFETLWLMPDEDKPKVKEIFEGAINTKLPATDNMRIKTSAHDYLWCRVTMHPLMDKDGKVVSVIGKIVDIDSQVKEKRWLEMRSKMDGLTGLLNKVSFQSDVADYMQTHKSTSCGIIFLDMDHFKTLNDTLGHMIGDKAIRDVAFSLTKIFGENDFISRFGGDEFCVFVIDISREKLIEKLEKALQVMTLTYEDQGQAVTLTASIGAVYNLDPKITFKELIELADNKLYEAKENGRNRYVMTIKQ